VPAVLCLRSGFRAGFRGGNWWPAGTGTPDADQSLTGRGTCCEVDHQGDAALRCSARCVVPLVTAYAPWWPRTTVSRSSKSIRSGRDRSQRFTPCRRQL